MGQLEYFTADLYRRSQSRVFPLKEWENASKLYLKHLSRILRLAPLGVKQLANAYLHDWRFADILIERPSRVVLKLRSSGSFRKFGKLLPRERACSFEFKGVTELNFRADQFIDPHGHEWGYGEIHGKRNDYELRVLVLPVLVAKGPSMFSIRFTSVRVRKTTQLKRGIR